MMQTEFEFVLPKGYVDKEGGVHRKGVMRLANAKDEIAPLEDPRVNRNQGYLVIILLARVIVSLGELRSINPGVIENLFSADLAYLQDFYRRINDHGEATLEVHCPECNSDFHVEDSVLFGEVAVGA